MFQLCRSVEIMKASLFMRKASNIIAKRDFAAFTRRLNSWATNDTTSSIRKLLHHMQSCFCVLLNMDIFSSGSSWSSGRENISISLFAWYEEVECEEVGAVGVGVCGWCEDLGLASCPSSSRCEGSSRDLFLVGPLLDSATIIVVRTTSPTLSTNFTSGTWLANL